MRHTEERAERWLELTEKTFNFARYAGAAFLKANDMGSAGLELKKEILMALGYNPKIKAGKLCLETMPWLIPIKNEAPLLQQQYLAINNPRPYGRGFASFKS